MSAELKQFPANPILPVIHIEDKYHASLMADIAAELGAGGVFLTDSTESGDKPFALEQAVRKVREDIPGLWLGVHCACIQSPEEAFRHFDGMDVQAIWTNNALGWDARRMNPYLIGDEIDLQLKGRNIKLASQLTDPPKVHFGGISMSGEGYEDKDKFAAFLIRQAQQYVDVVTTSPEWTTHAISQNRLEMLKAAMYKDGKLAVVGDITPLNLEWHLKLANYLLVDSPIFDREGLKQLMSVLRHKELVQLDMAASN